MPKDKEDKKKSARVSLSGMSIRAIQEMLNAKYGANTLITSAAAKGLVKRFTSTGVYALDFALGGGGIPENRITEIRGSYSSLKTTVMLRSIANHQIKYPDGLAGVIDLERCYDPDYAHILGCDPDRTFVVNPDSGEQASDVLVDLLSTEQDIFIGVDSLAALVPSAELEASFDSQSMALQARLVNKVLRVATARMKRSLYNVHAPTTTVLVLNQIRQKVGIMFGSPETTPGGVGKDFYYSVIITLRSTAGDSLIENEKVQDVEESVRKGQRVRYKIEKNKMSSSQFSEGEFEYYVKPHKGYKAFTFNNEEVLFRQGLFTRVVKLTVKQIGKKVSKTYSYDCVSKGSEHHFIEALRSRPKLCRRLYAEILGAISKAEGIVVQASTESDETSV